MFTMSLSCHTCIVYGPVENNLTDEVTNNNTEVEAAILGLEEAKKKVATTVILHTDSKLVLAMTGKRPMERNQSFQ